MMKIPFVYYTNCYFFVTRKENFVYFYNYFPTTKLDTEELENNTVHRDNYNLEDV